VPISGTARLDGGAHDWPHRHAAATRTIRQATDTTTLTSCPPPPTGPWSWPAAVDYSTVHTPVPLLFSPVSPAPRRRRRRRARAAVSGSLLLLQDSILPPSTATTTSLSKRSARPKAAARRQLHFGLRCCNCATRQQQFQSGTIHLGCMHAAYYAGHTQTGTASTA
jgi:hypothetical protein